MYKIDCIYYLFANKFFWGKIYETRLCRSQNAKLAVIICLVASLAGVCRVCYVF